MPYLLQQILWALRQHAASAAAIRACLQVDYKRGWGKLKSGNEVEVDLLEGGSETLNTKNVIIATGSEVAPLKGIEIDEDRYFSYLSLPISDLISIM